MKLTVFILKIWYNYIKDHRGKENFKVPVYYNADRKTWYAMFYAKDYKGVNKKYKKTGFKKKKEAQEYEYEFKKKIAKSMNMTFQSLYELYFEDYSKRHKPTAVNTVETFFRLHILPFFGEIEVNKITSFMIREWQNELLEKEHGNGQLFSENSKSNIYAALKSMFNWATKYQDLNENPCKNMGTFGSKKNRSEMKIWSVNDFEKFIEVLELKNKEKNGKYSDSIIVFKILFWTGLRIGELLALSENDINLEEKFIDVNKTLSHINKKDYITTPKTLGSIRKVLLPETLISDLQLYFSETSKINQNKKNIKTVRIFNLKSSQLRYILEKYSLQANLPKIRLHDFRHSHASYLLFIQADITAISKRLGHDNLQTTINTYSHLYKDANTQLIEKLNK